jgi:glucose-1-phosphate thymidylyltransferase
MRDMAIADALVLSGGETQGRGWPTAFAEPRPLFPIANRPILAHNLQELSSAGVEEAAVLAPAHELPAIRAAVSDAGGPDLCVRCAEWQPADGLAGALTMQRELLGDRPVIVQQAGALLREHMRRHVLAFARERLDALVLRADGPVPLSQRGSAPGYLLSPRAVSILADGRAPAGNPAAGVRAQGGRVRVQRVDALLACGGSLDSLLESNRCLLERLTAASAPEVGDGCELQGQVEVHPTARIERSLVRGPVIIGAGAQIVDSYVGPYTSIGDGVIVEGAEIEHSIVLTEAQLRFVGTRLESSVIGRGARVVREFSMPNALRMSLGDGAEVVLR